MKKIKHYWWILILAILFWIFGLISSWNKLTYKEFIDNVENASSYFVVDSPDRVIRQQFNPPFDIISDFSVKIGTFSRDNNSEWKVTLLESITSKIIYEWNFNASSVNDNAFYELKLKKPIRLNKSQTYELVISSSNCNKDTSLAFYGDQNRNNSKLTKPSGKENINLAFRVYGGDFDCFWISLYGIYTLIILSIIFRAYYLKQKGRILTNDAILNAMVVGTIYFTLMYIFSVPGTPTFVDENDNMRGGMLIANGSVLYRDYVTQHTPFAYYLCGLYALLGAGSVQQFRLLFYISCALVWGILYFRHAEKLGRIKMAILPFAQVFLLILILPDQNGQVLSDNIQGLAMVMLMLEFIEYRKDYEINWSRIAIISFSIFSSFGSAFISVYSIAVVFLFFIISEIDYFRKNKQSIIFFIRRYGRMILLCVLPFIITLLYFYIFGTLTKAYDMAYRFNQEVYPQYLEGKFGENKLWPIINGFMCYFGLIANIVSSILNGKASISSIVEILILLFIGIYILKLIWSKKYFDGLFLFLFLCMNATRGNIGFHSIAYWDVALLIFIIFFDMYEKNRRIKFSYSFISIILIICFINPYISAFGSYVFIEQPAVSDWENFVIRNTHEGEGILIETFYYDSLYLLYKKRYPVNRLTYFLPWYMDWYEQDTIDDLRNNAPNIVVYNPEMEVWKKKHFFNALNTEIEMSYDRVNDNLPVYLKKR